MSRDYLEQFIRIIEEAIKRKRTTALEASSKAVGNPYMVRNMKTGKIPRLDRAKRLCDALGLSFFIGFPEDYPTQTEIPLFGVSEGEKVSSDYDLASVGLEDLKDCAKVSAPMNVNSAIAVRISDDSLAPVASQGDLIFAYLGDRLANKKGFEDSIGKLCLAQTEEGILICTLRRGDTANKWNLESIADNSTLVDQELAACLAVRWIGKSI